jgi:hypothetical protein
MTLMEFNILDEAEQQEALWDKGVHIGERQESPYRIILYQLDSFYVEVFYHMEYNQIHQFRNFSSTDELNKITLMRAFEKIVNDVTVKFCEINIPTYTAFHVSFSSSRRPLIVARSKDSNEETFWTSIPEGRQKEAEGVGKLIDEYLKTKEVT